MEWPAEKIRSTFIRYFEEEKGHTHWPSSSVVPHEDPTLLFANAGMNQYKSIFLGTIDPSAPMAKLKRAVNSQKCIRAGGKHNDLDDVGKDLYHHTFFEMLGNWSFGDYFKKEAIRMAWECLTVVFGLEPKRLYATYFGGDDVAAPGVPPDLETREFWLEFLPPERVLAFDAKDNFWEMGDQGPCGPCTEIHYDRIGGGRDAAPLVNQDDPNVLEIWNNVFIQFNRDSGGLKELPSQHVDTGMGFERLASILQKKMSNYDTDVFTPLFDAIQKEAGCAGYEGLLEADRDVAYRVVADHVRTLSFAIADGAVPDNLGRGYVLRRVLRRAVWYAQHHLEAPKSFLHKLVPTLADSMGEAYPELKKSLATIQGVLESEERDFNRTIDKGARFFAKRAAESETVISGADAFHLAATLGFPLDLTQIMAERKGMTVDVEGFQDCLAQDKAKNLEALKARKAARQGAADMSFGAEQVATLSHLEKTKVDPYSATRCVELEEEAATVIAIFGGRVRGFVDEATTLTGYCGLVLDATSFYAEMGGQCADTGSLFVEDSEVFSVEDVQAYGGYVVHSGVAVKPLAVGATVSCRVDYDRRAKIAPNHTMTHVLNFAIREVLGDGCAQRGSSVDDERLRFDFAYDKALSKEEVKRIEDIVRDNIQKALPVDAQNARLADAMKIETLRSMRGEIYPDPARIVSVGVSVDALLSNPSSVHCSAELCGGTHVKNTKDAVDFALLEETAVSKGVRRIVAVTREKAAEARATAVAAKDRIARLALEEEEEENNNDVSAAKKLKDLRLSLDAMVMPAVDKLSVRESLAELVEKVKKAQKAEAAKAEKAVEAEFEALAKAGGGAARIDFGANSKLFAKMQKSILSKLAPDASFCVVSSDTAAVDKKFVIYTIVSKAHHDDKDLDAAAWARAAADAAGGGRGGGKGLAANVTVVVSDTTDLAASIDAAIEAAKTYLLDNNITK
ncbi:hypothetical protein CTAYLR_000523 [Chrysophaeum taylorii]|uniref:Alanine--tRNA ligase n=1 Tax=Chrysophaeum taylorii TaxID=2483200 RepID=A0AAD7UH52_9STRA|nr:hypothetical protein CTAYLR_000523 [Chrysophaeum taylorii]